MTATGGAPGAVSDASNARPKQRLDSQEVEAVRGHPGDIEALGAVLALPEHRVAAGADHVFERGGLLLIVEELRRREVRAAVLPIGAVAQHDVHQPIGSRVRKRIQHDVADDAVDDGHRGDAERQGERRRDGERGRLRQGAHAVRDIAPEILDPAERSGIALQLFDLLDAPEPAPRGVARLLRRQSAALELTLQLPEVGVDLVCEVAFGALVAERPSGDAPGSDAACPSPHLLDRMSAGRDSGRRVSGKTPTARGSAVCSRTPQAAASGRSAGRARGRPTW